LLILLALGGTLVLAGQARTPRGGPSGGGSSTQADAQQHQLGDDQLARISVELTPSVARRVERVRELRFEQLPKPEVVTSEFLNRLGIRELERQSGRLGLGSDDAVGRITGLLEPGEELEAAYTSTGDLAAAAYDPKTKRLYVVSDAVVANRALVQFVLAHELDHALEDQHFGLSGGGKLSDDAGLAEQALVEGSATSVMTDFAVRYLDPLALLAASGTIDSGTGDVPKAFVDQLTWSYLGGARFIGALRELAGGWKLVDYALETRPPATSEQILHPRKYVRDELPSAVRIDSAELRDGGWRLADRNVFGELPTSYLLRVGVDPEQAKAAAAGWNGDRYELWRRDLAPGACEYPCRSDFVLVARWSWDTGRDRRQFGRAATAYIEDGLAGESLKQGVWRIEDGFVALSSEGPDTTLAFAPDPDQARAIAAAPTARVGR
jgi:hypothetical protein